MKYKLNDTSLIHIVNEIKSQLIKDTNEISLPEKNIKGNQDVKAKINNAIASCYKEIMASIKQSKEWYSSIKEREKKLKSEISNKWPHPSNILKLYILHIQNEAIINYLAKFKKHLDAVRSSQPVSYIKVNSINTPLPEGRIENLMLGLKKIQAIIEYSERRKKTTNEFIETDLFPFKAIISKLAGSTVKITRELTIELHTTQNYRYLQRRLFILSNPDMFDSEREKLEFLNAIFFESTIKSYGNSSVNE